MALIALKIDVDTYRGTREGVLRLADLLQKLGAARHLSVQRWARPHRAGDQARRFGRGFLGKVKRTSVVEHYGLKTLMYGVLLPGPTSGGAAAASMQEIARAVSKWACTPTTTSRWQDGVAHASEAWTRRELTLARDEFVAVFGRAPAVHGAAGWQMNHYLSAARAASSGFATPRTSAAASRSCRSPARARSRCRNCRRRCRRSTS